MKNLQYIAATAIMVLVASCGGGGGSSGAGESRLQPVVIDTPEKAQNTLYVVGRNAEDLYALTGWSEMILETINNRLVEAKERAAESPYNDVNLSCPVKGMMTVNGSIALNGSREYDIEVVLKDCYMDRDTGLEGAISYKGRTSDKTALQMTTVMKDFRIGLYLLDETTADVTIETQNDPDGGNYENRLNGTVNGRLESVKYSDYTLSIDNGREGKPQSMSGTLELTKSETPCIVGRYDISTVTPLTESGKIKVNNAVIIYKADKSNTIEFDGNSVDITTAPKLSCS